MPYSHRELIERTLKLLADIREIERTNSIYLEPRIYLSSACDALIKISKNNAARRD
jgi:hypothetical protein|tara:strand:+ start:914 stop:1081 length:168 start_codon:yes stop_codon:yes gene_type:complete